MPRLDASAMTQPLGGSTHGDTIRSGAFYSPCLFVQTTTRVLELHNNAPDRRGAVALLSGSLIEGLEELSLSSNWLRPGWFVPLDRLARLRRLELSGNELGDADAETLAEHPPPNLSYLGLEG